MGYSDLHRHDERSLFDGFGKPQELAKIAKELGYDALGISNHGDMSSLVSHYFGCKNEGIKPIMGNEVYFMPTFKQIRKSYHLCLFVKNLKGYKNLNRMIAYASKKQYYYKPIIDFKLLEKHSEGLICTSACIGGAISQLLVRGEEKLSYKVAKKFQSIFGDDFYIEIQPYVLTEEGLQEKVNNMLFELAEELDIKCILTSDSHFGRKDDFDTYLKMHELGGHLELGKQYNERYMPSGKAMRKRLVRMHGDDLDDVDEFYEQCIENIEEIVDKVDDEILEKLDQSLPDFEDVDNPTEKLWDNIIKGLKEKHKYKKSYVKRCKEEFEVICCHGFEAYFLIVQDYVAYSKERGIEVGPGRGSVCNCLIAYALDITEVDSLLFDLDFRRFLRKDKKKLPDIDIDFETDRRVEVIEYLVEKYKGHAARICSYGLYKVDNLLNDLFKICGLALADKKDPDKKEKDIETKNKQKEIKATVKQYIDLDSGDFGFEKAMEDSQIRSYNKKYDNIIIHFSKLYKKMRFYGTHAAGVAITGSSILDYTALERRAGGAFTTSYDLIDIEQIKGVKFDMLGLRTMSILRELREKTGQKHKFNYEWLRDERLYENFKIGNTDGIFQFEAKGAQSVLREIEADCLEDVIAASALNRPGPLSLGMVEQYARSKKAASYGDDEEDIGASEVTKIFNKYASDTYGCFVYQEQVMQICVNVAGMEWSDADKIMKMMKNNKTMTEKALKEYNEQHDRLRKLFIEGAQKKGYSKKVAKEVFDKLQVYTFNKGHAVGYTLISIEQMFYKVYYPNEFWYVTLKFANEFDYTRLSCKACKDGAVLLLPHVNGSADHTLSEVDGEVCIQEGMSLIKGVGEKAAAFIEQERIENGDFEDADDFYDRIEPYKRVVNKGVIEKLEESGALEFNRKTYFGRVNKYNSSLYSRGYK